MRFPISYFVLLPIGVFSVPVYFFSKLVQAEQLVQRHGDTELIVGARYIIVGAGVVYLELFKV